MSSIRKSILDNGISVITEKMSDVESASLGIWVKTGSRHETPRINGISHFIEHMLFKGTPSRSALDIAKEIESVGGVLNAFTGREYTCFYSKVLSDNLPLATDLLSDIFLNSLFETEELEKEKKVVLQEIKMVDDTPDDLVHDLFSETFWPEQPMGRPILGRRSTLKSLTRRDIKGYMSRRYSAESVFITATGNVNHGALVRALKLTLGKIKKRANVKDPKAPVSNRAVKLLKRDLEQVHLCMGVPVPSMTDKKRFELYLINTMLGSGMSSRLFQEIREKRGLAYSVYSYLNLCKDTGALVVYAGTSKESFGEVTGLVLREFEKLGDELTDEQLNHTKDQLKGGIVLALETTDARMMKIAKDEIYFGKSIPIKSLIKEVDRVKVEDVRKSVKELLNPERITLTAIGGGMKKRELPSVLRSK
jgi:predicted Zn-dependent peptidase